MTTTLICALVSLIILTGGTTNARNCLLRNPNGDEVSDTDWSIGVVLADRLSDNTPANKEFYYFDAENTLAAYVSENENSTTAKYDKFFNSSLTKMGNSSRLSLFTSVIFPDIDQNIDRQIVPFTVEFQCQDGEAKLLLEVFVIDANSHVPEFDDPHGYVFDSIPMPMPANFDFSPIFRKITVTDLDAASLGVEITIHGDYSEYFMASLGKKTDRSMDVYLKTTKTLDLLQSVDFNISATDLGTKEDPNTHFTTSVTVTVNPDRSSVDYDLRFIKELYTAVVNYTVGVITHEISMNIKPNDETTLVISDGVGNFDYSKYVACVWIGNSSHIECHWIDGIDDTPLLNKTSAVIVITAKSGDKEANTVLYLVLNDMEKPTKPDCILINANGSVVSEDEWNSVIDLEKEFADNVPAGVTLYKFHAKNIVSVKVTDNNDYFQFILEEDGQLLLLLTSDNFPYIDTQLQDQIIRVPTEFKCKKGSRNTAIEFRLQDFNNHPPKFDSHPGYVFKQLPMPLPDHLDLTPVFQTIYITDDDVTSRGMNIILDEAGSEYFNVSLSAIQGSTKKFQVTLKTNSLLQLREPIEFRIDAQDFGTAIDKTSLMSQVSVRIEPVNSEWHCQASD